MPIFSDRSLPFSFMSLFCRVSGRKFGVPLCRTGSRFQKAIAKVMTTKRVKNNRVANTGTAIGQP
jgi:hypothetical protein